MKLDNESSGSLSPEEIASLRAELATSRSLIEQHEQTINELQHTKESLERKREDLETRLTALELEYEELLGKFECAKGMGMGWWEEQGTKAGGY